MRFSQKTPILTLSNETNRKILFFILVIRIIINTESYVLLNKLLQCHVFEFGIIIRREAFTTIRNVFCGRKFPSLPGAKKVQMYAVNICRFYQMVRRFWFLNNLKYDNIIFYFHSTGQITSRLSSNSQNKKSSFS